MYSLAVYAMRDADSRGRFNQENYHDTRGIYERDRDRIIHCEAFRKLEYKTQVFVNHEGDYYRTRLTHTMEVSQIARSLAKRLGLNIELVEAVALAHDLGHTPFGHTGEAVLDRLLAGHGGFEHNRQSYRIVTSLERRYHGFDGLNLSYETLEGIIKHSYPYDTVYNADLEDKFSLKTVPVLESQIIDHADEIAYLNHDLDDGLESGLLDWQDLDSVRVWKETRARDAYSGGREIDKFRAISSLISLFIDDLAENTLRLIEYHGIDSVAKLRKVNKSIAAFSGEVDELRLELKAYLYQNLYRHPKVERMRVSAERCIEGLYNTITAYPALLPLRYREEAEKTGLERAAADYIAGMTDRFAIEEHRRLNNAL